MDLESIREYALSLPGATEDMPFGDGVVALRVGGKIFMLMALDGARQSINLKCNPARAQELRVHYRQIEPGYHMNKRHWNTLRGLDTLPRGLIEELIAHSYALVFGSLPGRERRRIEGVSAPMARLEDAQ